MELELHPQLDVHAALRARTREIHQSLEDSLRIAVPHPERADYVQHVAALSAWMKTNEAALWRGDWPSEMNVSERARKREWLEADLAAARGDGFMAGTLEAIPALGYKSMAARFGTAYVIEGSMLGGAMLLNRMRDRLAPWPLRYLQGYGDLTGVMWRRFLASLSEYVASPAEIEEAARAAYRTFASLQDAFDRVRAG